MSLGPSGSDRTDRTDVKREQREAQVGRVCKPPTMFGVRCEAAETCEQLLWVLSGVSALGPDAHSRKGFAKHGPKCQPGIFSVRKSVSQDHALHVQPVCSAHLITGGSLACG